MPDWFIVLFYSDGLKRYWSPPERLSIILCAWCANEKASTYHKTATPFVSQLCKKNLVHRPSEKINDMLMLIGRRSNSHPFSTPRLPHRTSSRRDHNTKSSRSTSTQPMKRYKSPYLLFEVPVLDVGVKHERRRPLLDGHPQHRQQVLVPQAVKHETLLQQ